MQLAILSAGAWGPGFIDWASLKRMLLGGDSPVQDQPKSPKPEIIPPNERRRAPLPVRLAVETSSQALQAANIDATEAACVFASGLGDTDITDYMCRILAGENKMISPTKFHNSVHNAPAGYWTISTGCMHGANSVAAFDNSFSLALMEAAVQCTLEQVPVLVSCFDSPSPDPLRPILRAQDPFCGSLLLHPNPGAGTPVNIEPAAQAAHWPALDNPALQPLYETNQSARMLYLLQAWAKEPAEEMSLHLPTGEQTSLAVTLGGQS